MRIKGRIYARVADMELEIFTSKEPLTFQNRREGEYRRVAPGDKWGDLFDCAWFHCTARIPSSAVGQKLVYILDINGEGLLFDEAGCPVQGITNVNSGFDRAMGNPGKRVVPFADPYTGAEKADFWMDAGCNDLVGNLQEDGRVKEAYVASCNDVARELFYDAIVLLTQAEMTPRDDPMRYELLDTLSRCHRLLRRYTDEEFRQCLELTRHQLKKRGGDGAGISLTAFGHAHIDLAWLWPLRETRRKGARTFATALSLMERYPDYRFAASQGQLYQWVKEDHPALYEKVRKAVTSGRWELQGAMWVESDANLVSGESLIRQILYGNAFWEKEFGKRSSFVWMPDTFGYSAALPQIFSKAEITGFATIKMSWNLINRFPYTSFRWRGIDGSEVLVHMPPEGNYVSEATPKSVFKARKNMAQNGQYGEALLPFGIGDGGGGPSPCHLEYLKREKNLPGLCPVEQGTMRGFFERLSHRSDSLPVWQNELYLERHLGVYTSAARNKKYNRKMELELRNAEILSAFAFKLTGMVYPQRELESLWKETLLYQFHDILPGSSIRRVYDECLARYAIMLEQAQALTERAARCLAEQVDTGDAKKPAVLFNTLSFARRCWVRTAQGVVSAELPPMGYTVVDLEQCRQEIWMPAENRILENELLRAEFAEDGSLCRLYRKDLERELLEKPSNVLLMYQDVENAWNLQYDYPNQIPECMMLTGAVGECCCGISRIRQRYVYRESAVELTLILRPRQPFLEIEAEVDWHQHDTMLRIAFVPAVHTERVESEIQFGYISRSALDNTPQEQAQMELSAHRWIAMREPGLNFALLNDCKYGYSVRDGVLELNALRGTDYPGKDLDQGKHSFRYALYADAQPDLVQVSRQAFAFNVAPVVCPISAQTGTMTGTDSFLHMTADNVFIDTVKKAEESDVVVIRTYEAVGRSVSAKLAAGRLGNELMLSNLVERQGQPAEEYYRYRPFDLVTYMVR